MASAATATKAVWIPPACPLKNEKGKVIKDPCNHRVGCFIVLFDNDQFTIHIEHAKGMEAKMQQFTKMGRDVLVFGKDKIPDQHMPEVQRILHLYFDSLKKNAASSKHISVDSLQDSKENS